MWTRISFVQASSLNWTHEQVAALTHKESIWTILLDIYERERPASGDSRPFS
jgi:hypothetical protein